jgi:DNA polymerase-3 subunit beta
MAQRNSPLRLSFEDGTLTVSATTQDIGAAVETLAIKFDGEPLVIGFNADFLRDGIQSVEGDTILIKLLSPTRAAVLSGENADFSYLIMPVRIPG